MSWFDIILYVVGGAVAVVLFGVGIYHHTKPVEFESCVLKPRGFERPRKRLRPRKRQRK